MTCHDPNHDPPRPRAHAEPAARGRARGGRQHAASDYYAATTTLYYAVVIVNIYITIERRSASARNCKVARNVCVRTYYLPAVYGV